MRERLIRSSLAREWYLNKKSYSFLDTCSNQDNIREREKPGAEIRRFLTLYVRNFTYSTLGF